MNSSLKLANTQMLLPNAKEKTSVFWAKKPNWSLEPTSLGKPRSAAQLQRYGLDRQVSELSIPLLTDKRKNIGSQLFFIRYEQPVWRAIVFN